MDPKTHLEAKPSNPLVLYNTPSHSGKNVACVGAGTGLGACFLTPSSKGYLVSSSEAGMSETICPRTETEWKLLEYLRKGSRHSDIETIVCGNGILEAYKFFAMSSGEAYMKSEPYLSIVNASREVSPEMVSNNAQKHDEQLCLKAIDTFLSFFGRFLATTAVSFLPYSGIYIAGGILPKLLWRLKEGDNPLIGSYLDQSDTVRSVITKIPIYVFDDPDSASKGCLYYAINK
eukprot:TRINITY_DN7415_c0_g1_i2.p1 TRINITY_DN7415_c0_g1~~TRINITY_DN7415_c0_g1_i2.p1  ORF type:complete len:232 (+),score=11.39 TRINITY_DN7415_c0_g1_i2:437-1132(+)